MISILGGFAAYVMVGFLTSSDFSEEDSGVHDEGGPGLVFVAYPTGKITFCFIRSKVVTIILLLYTVHCTVYTV